MAVLRERGPPCRPEASLRHPFHCWILLKDEQLLDISPGFELKVWV